MADQIKAKVKEILKCEPEVFIVDEPSGLNTCGVYWEILESENTVTLQTFNIEQDIEYKNQEELVKIITGHIENYNENWDAGITAEKLDEINAGPLGQYDGTR